MNSKRSSRQEKVEVAQETLRILQSRQYGIAGGEHVEFGPQLDAAITGTILYPENVEIGSSCGSSFATGMVEGKMVIKITNETTLAAGKRLYNSIQPAEDESLCVLNFASAKNPGGGFQTGAEAQEESLARASGLYACLQGHNDDFYEPNRRNPHDGLYSHAILYSPNVPFFRTDAGTLCPPWYASVITAPAPNAGVALKKRGAAEVRQALHERCGRILRAAKLQRQTHLVLGAFGCGVFQNDPQEVADAFDAWLATAEFVGAFRHVVFAIVGSKHNNNLDVFKNRFSATAVRTSSAGYAAGKSAPNTKVDQLPVATIDRTHVDHEMAQVECIETESKKGRWRKMDCNNPGKNGKGKEGERKDVSSPATVAAGVQQVFDFFVVLDFEATCDEGSRQPQPQEIIEFPLVLVDSRTLRVVDEFRSYVRPQHHPQLTAFCRSLTGIQQSQIDEAPAFRDVFHQACNWLHKHGLLQQDKCSAALVTCGDWDLRTMLPAQLRVASLQKTPKIFREWVNIKKTYTAATGKRSQGMAGMLQDLGIPLVGHHHSGLDDSRNIAQILICLCRHCSVDVNGWIW